MIQITPQMRILVAVEPVDFRKGIDGLAAICRQALEADPLDGTLFVFCGRSRRALKCLVYDSQGFWLAQNRIAYNSRYLILPWVKVPHLASHLLARIARRIGDDWEALYHHRVYLLESFVDIERFQGTCYRAAGWVCVGRSEGRGTKSKAGARTSIKELWVRPLEKGFRAKLLAP